MQGIRISRRDGYVHIRAFGLTILLVQQAADLWQWNVIAGPTLMARGDARTEDEARRVALECQAVRDAALTPGRP